MKPLSIVTVKAVAASLAALVASTGCGGGGAAASTASGSGGPAAAAAAPDSTSTSVGSPTPAPSPTAAPTPALPAHVSPSPSPSPTPHPSPAPTPAPISTGTGGSGGSVTQTTTITISNPIAITYDPSRNVIYEAEEGGAIRQVSLDGNVATVGSAPSPSALAVKPSGPVFVTSTEDAYHGLGSVYSLDPSTHSSTPILHSFYAKGVVVRGNALLLSMNTAFPARPIGVWAFNLTNGNLSLFGDGLEGPRGLTVTPSGGVAVLDTGSDYANSAPRPCALDIIAPSGTTSTVVGTDRQSLSDPPKCQQSPLGENANGVTVDGQNNLYVADTLNNRVLKITLGGGVSVLAGNGTAGDVDANGSAAEFDRPSGIVLASDGNLYVADTGNNSIRRVTLSGAVSTLV